MAMEAKQTVDFLLSLAHHVEPLEHVIGRIEMRVPLTHLPSLMTLLSGIDVENGVKSIPGLKGYDVNTWHRSATIRYDPNVLPFDLWNDFCTIKQNPSAETSFRERLLSVFDTHSVQNQE
jgi:hypothetical protein